MKTTMSQATKITIPYVPASVFVGSMVTSEYFDLSCEDLSQLRLTCKEFREEVSRATVLETAYRKRFPEFCNCMDKLGMAAIGQVILSSDINVIEVETLLTNMQTVQNRRFGTKYGYLFQQKLIREHHDDRVITTLGVLRGMFEYAGNSRLTTHYSQKPD